MASGDRAPARPETTPADDFTLSEVVMAAFSSGSPDESGGRLRDVRSDARSLAPPRCKDMLRPFERPRLMTALEVKDVIRPIPGLPNASPPSNVLRDFFETGSR
jgi:hypothetical protein